MDKSSAQAAFSLKRTSDGAPVSGSFGWYGAGVLLFKPDADLAPGTQYTASVSTAAKDLAGNSLAAAKTWQFTTSNPPVINFVRPAEDATEVQQNTTIVVAFDRAMDKSSAQARLLAEADQRRGAGERKLRLVRPRRAALQARRRPGTWDAIHGERFDRRQGPRRELAGGREDLAVHDGEPPGRQQRLSGRGRDRRLSQLADAASSSTRPMDKASAQAAFSLKRTSDGAPVSGSFGWYGSGVLIFKPDADLAPGTQYTASVSTAAKDLQGNTLANPVTWSYTTGASG